MAMVAITGMHNMEAPARTFVASKHSIYEEFVPSAFVACTASFNIAKAIITVYM